jgi:hypothetical protein
MKSFAKDGRHLWISIAVTTGVGISLGFLIAGITELAGN